MSDWIKKKSAQLGEQRRRQEHVRELLPAKAEDMWKGLVIFIETDVQQINGDGELVQGIGGRLTFSKLSETVFQIVKESLPTRRVKVAYNKPAATLTVTEHRLHSPATREIELPLPLLSFKLDNQDNIFVEDGDGKKLTLEQVSELWLSPFLNQ